MRFAFIAVEKAHHSITLLCRCLRVTRSGFYASQRRPESARRQADRRLRVRVRASFDASRRTYGSPRIHRDLLEDHERVSRKRVVRLMQEEGLRARPRKRFKVTTISDHDQPVADNVLNRQFTRRPAESAVGRRHDGVGHRRQRQAVPGRDPRSVLAICRRLGRQRRQRPASDDEGVGHGVEASMPQCRACSITPTRGARMPARTTRRCSRRTASRAV